MSQIFNDQEFKQIVNQFFSEIFTNDLEIQDDVSNYNFQVWLSTYLQYSQQKWSPYFLFYLMYRAKVYSKGDIALELFKLAKGDGKIHYLLIEKFNYYLNKHRKYFKKLSSNPKLWNKIFHNAIKVYSQVSLGNKLVGGQDEE